MVSGATDGEADLIEGKSSKMDLGFHFSNLSRLNGNLYIDIGLCLQFLFTIAALPCF